MSGQSSEIIRCPNCKEDVPKTLYCLNCGYPLYKLEQQKKSEELIIKQEQELELEEEIDMSVEIEPHELIVEKDNERSNEEPEIEININVDEELEPIEEIEEALTEEEPEPKEEEIEEALTEEEPEPKEEEIEAEFEKDIITTEEREAYMIQDIRIEFAPDLLTKEVMESLAKNITLKVRLVRLLCENQVKEETFKKLFDSYVDQGRLWIGRREEIIKRYKSDIARMEQELISTRKDFELLEIRKNIGDASEEEYSIKVPAFKWDIENLEKEIKNTRGGIQYVINLKSLIPDEEIEELRHISESDYSELNNLDGVSIDTLDSMKETLKEALNSLES